MRNKIMARRERILYSRQIKVMPIVKYRLGSHYEFRKGVEQDFEKAVNFYKQAAEQGHGEAQFNLGRLSRDGNGVECDLARAKHYFELAAGQGLWQPQDDEL